MISSAVGGKRAAPKSAVRRRPPAKPQADQASIEADFPRAAPAETVSDIPTASATPNTSTSALAALSVASEGAPLAEPPQEVADHGSTIQNNVPSQDQGARLRAEPSQAPQPEVSEASPASKSTSNSNTRQKPRSANARRSKRKSAPLVVNSDDEDARQGETSPPSAVAEPRKRARRKKKVKEASAVDGKDDSSDEEHEMNPSNATMFELSFPSKRGKASEREKRMAEIDWAEVARKRQEEVERIKAGQANDKAHADQVVESTELADGQASATPADQNGNNEATGIGLRIVNGQIVEDETTLSIDQNAQAHANAINDDEVEEENDLTERMNRATYINNRRRDPRERVPIYKSKSDPWTDEETDKFYDALRMFGTDFDIISKMFPPKTRMQVKKKFIREEKIDLARINAALLGKENKPMNLEYYAREVGEDVSVYTKYESYEHATQIIRESMKDREEELAAALQENTETQRQQDIQQKQQEAAEKRKQDRKEKAAARKANKGKKPGIGTLGGGGPEEVVVDTTEN